MTRLKKNVKKTLVSLAAGLAIAGASVAGTLAYLTDSKGLTNTISPENNEVEIHEEFNPPEELTEGVNTYKKAIRIDNTGETPAYVRVYVGFSDKKIADATTVTANGTDYYSMAEFNAHLPSGWEYVPETDNVLGGFYYYTGIVPAGTSTSNLTDTFKTTFASADDVQPFDIIVYTESVSTLDKDGNTTFSASVADGTVNASDPAWKKAWKEHLKSVVR